MNDTNYGKCKKCTGSVIEDPEIVKRVGPYFLIYLLIYFAILLIWTLKIYMPYYNIADAKSATLTQHLVGMFAFFACYMSFCPSVAYDNYGRVLLCDGCGQRYKRNEYSAHSKLTITKYIIGCFIVAAIFEFGMAFLDWFKDSYL